MRGVNAAEASPHPHPHPDLNPNPNPIPNPNPNQATRAAASNLSGDDQMLLPLFDAIKGFAEADDSAEPVPLPSGLTGFQRAMVRQYSPEPSPEP